MWDWMARATADNRRCKDKGPHPHHAASFSVCLSPLGCLSQNQSFPLSFFLSHAGSSPFSSTTLSPLLHFLRSVYPSHPHHHLLSLPPVLPLLSPMSTAAENPAQTPACVCLYMCVCATTVDPRAKAHRIMSKEGREINPPPP